MQIDFFFYVLYQTRGERLESKWNRSDIIRQQQVT